MTLHPYGPSNWLIRWDKRDSFNADAPAVFHALKSQPPEYLIEYVPGYQTILLQFRQPIAEKSIRQYLSDNSEPAASNIIEPRIIEVPVVYDGPDLEIVAKARRITTDEVICRHTERVYTVYFMGFSPGFPYLGPLDTVLHTPRRASPRTRIPAGSVAIGGSHTGIYSVDSPGGWHIIGRTSLSLFNRDAAKVAHPDSEDVFAFQPGIHVQFVTQR